jgi:hypothetical protein
MAHHAPAQGIKRDRLKILPIAQMARQMMEQCRNFRAVNSERRRAFQRVVALIRVEGSELVAQQDFILSEERSAALDVVHDIEVRYGTAVPRKTRIP